MKAAKASVWDFIRECPRAGEIKAAYDAAGLSETEAFEALLTALTFNAAGAGNSGLNLLYYLPLAVWRPHCAASLPADAGTAVVSARTISSGPSTM